MLLVPLLIGAKFPRGMPRSRRSEPKRDPCGAWPLQAGLPDLHVYFDQMLLPFSDRTDSPFPEDPGSWVLRVLLEPFGCSKVSLSVEIPVGWVYPSELGLFLC